MKHYAHLEHNSGAWYDARAGLATTSEFGKIITPKGDLSSQADGYANKIIAELILGKPIDRNFDVYAMVWGREHEGDACNLYSFETNFDIRNGGFFTNDEMTLGSSPDVIVSDDGKDVGLAEIKCPENPAVHVEFLLLKQINPKYKPQVFGQLLVCEAEWVDWFSYYPEMPTCRVRTYRDTEPEYMKRLEDALNGFEELIQKKLGQLKELGHIDEIPKKRIKSKEEKEKEQLEEIESYFSKT